MLPRRQVVLRARKERRMDSFTSRVCAMCFISVLSYCSAVSSVTGGKHSYGQGLLASVADGHTASSVCDACATISHAARSLPPGWLLKSRLGSHPARQVVTASVLLGKFSQ
jgi:hypothetical protein